MIPNGPSSPPREQHPRDDRVERALARADAVRVPRVVREARGPVLQDDAGALRQHAGAEQLEEALDVGDGRPVLVDDAQVGGVRRRPGARGVVERAVGGDQRAPARQVLGVEQERRQRPVEDVAAGVGERQLHRLDLGVQPADQVVALEPVVDPEGHQRGGARAVRRQLADLEPAVGAAQRLDPLAAVGRQVLDVEPGGRRDRLGDGPLVEARRALLGDPPERAAEVRQRVALARARRGPRRPALLEGPLPAVGRPRAGEDPCSARSIAGASARSRPSRPKRSARSAQGRTAPGTVHERGPNSSTTRSARRPGARPEPFRPSARRHARSARRRRRRARCRSARRP